MAILLTNYQCPGDILMLTACVRDLKKAHPHTQIIVHTSAMELWDNNPYIVQDLSHVHRIDKHIDMHYPLINTSTQGAHHFIHGFTQYLEDQLNLKIPVTDFCADIHLSYKEKLPIYAEEQVGTTNYWIIDAGYKNDFTCKMWEFNRYQQVVDATKDRITWVQIGSAEHNHKVLNNVVNMVGKTNHRQLIQLMYHAKGVLTPVSYPMHLSTIPMPDGRKRPCIVIAGAREPSVWEQYTCHQYLHNCGALDCCKDGACWRSRIQKLDDNDEKNNSLCLKPVTTLSGQIIPKCLDMITVDNVLAKINMYIN